MQAYYTSFREYVGARETPCERETALYARAQRHLWRLRRTPGLAMVAVCNSLSYYGTHEDSDIDLFIVTEPRRLWLVRTIFTLYFALLGIRKDKKSHRGQFCLSFFVTTNALDLGRIAIEDDVYLYYWLYYLRPIIDSGDTYAQLVRANPWVTLPPSVLQDNLRYLVATPSVTPLPLGWLWSLLDATLKAILLPKALASRRALGYPWGIIITDDMLKFHDDDRRREVRERMVRV